MTFFLSCDEELRRPIVDRTRPKTRAAKPRVLLLVNLSLLVGLGRCRVEWLYGNVLVTLFHYIGYYDVARETGYKFRPPKITVEEYFTTQLRTNKQPRHKECWSP